MTSSSKILSFECRKLSHHGVPLLFPKISKSVGIFGMLIVIPKSDYMCIF